MKNVLYISYDGMTDPLGQSQVLPYLVGLSQVYDFHLISFEKADRYTAHKAVIQQICDENNIVWHPLMYTKRPPVLSTIYDVYQLFRLAKKLDQQLDFKILHCRSYISSLVGLSFKKKHQKKFIFDMRGFWADERVDGGIWNLKNPIFKSVYRFFKKKERAYLEHADAVVSLTYSGVEEMNTWGIDHLMSKTRVIPCAADFDHFALTEDSKKLQAKRKINVDSDTFVLTYIGSIGTWYMLDEMLHFYSVLKKHIPNSVFMLLTPEPENLVYESALKYHLSTSDFIIKYVQRNELPSYAYATDLSIFFIKPAYSKKSSSPTKMGELMAMGIPILCNSGVGDVQKIVDESNCGFCIDEFTETEFEKVISQLDTISTIQPMEIREKSKIYYLLDNGINNYKEVYQNLLK